MQHFILLLAVLWLGAIPVDADDKLDEVPLDPEVGTYVVGDYRYVLSVVVTNDGRFTKVGALYRDGLPIAGGDYYRLELPVGSFIWHPPKDGGEETGWPRINPGMKHLRWSMALIERAPAKEAKFLKTVQRDPIPADPPGKRKPKVADPGPPRYQGGHWCAREQA